MGVTLRDYQIRIAEEGLGILRKYGMVYLALQVRTGKTMTSLKIADMYGANRVLFLTKKKVLHDIISQWESMVLLNLQNLDVTNYESLHKYTGEPELIICDESHQLGQYPTPANRTKLLKKLVGTLPVIYLSGTPSPESYSQLYHQFYISDNSPFRQWPSFYKWAKEFVNVKKKYLYNREINDYSNANKEKIDELTKHLFISFTQEEAGFTEYVDEEVLTVKMKDSTYRIADALRKHRIVQNKAGDVILADTAVKMQQKLHQIYSGTVILDNEARSSTAFDDSKAVFIKERFSGSRIAIFYKFVAEGVILKGLFDWTTSPEEFNQSDNKIFISQIQSGREGINLSSADALVMYNIDFSAVSYWQSRARLQTRDRDKAAKVYWVFAEGGIEPKVYQAVQDKKDYTIQYFKRDYTL